MNSNLIIWPVLAQVILTWLIFIILGIRKAKDVKAGNVDRSKAALDNKAWSVDVIKVSNNIANQFQTPILFYVLSFIIFSLNIVTTISLALAWIYVLSRYLHAYVHIGSNYVPYRMNLFLLGCITLIALTIYCVWMLAINSNALHILA
ncbi:MAG: hypothetical protein HN764_09315 [Gammaproteobacteria bacterium]|jgi:hypothetical protein|nr:hypothetical protein [Gammaproteobacteria bacterium]